MFGTASTGTAIAALSGAAKTNDILAWFGGGAKAAGGLGMEGIAKMSDNYSSFIKKLNKMFAPFLQELERIKNAHPVDVDGMIDFDSLSVVEQKTLHVSWLMAQVYYHVLSTPILNSKGEVSKEANEALSASTKSLKQIKKDTYTMVAEESQVGDIIWKPEANKILVVNFFAVGILIALGCLSMSTSVIKSILFILCGAVAFPIFFKFRSLPASRLYTWRLVRLIGAIVIAIEIVALL